MNRAGACRHSDTTKSRQGQVRPLCAGDRAQHRRRVLDVPEPAGPGAGAAAARRPQPLIEPWFYASGYPISDAYWAQADVGGKVQDVLIQAFERRVLTYTPTNPAGLPGRDGQHRPALL